jgi:hypothetical protein
MVDRNKITMKNANIVLDFTLNKSLEEMTTGQPVAIMPEWLAIEALKSLAKDLSGASLYDIIEMQVEKLRSCKNLNDTKIVSIEYVQKRDLIDNLVAENWSAYKVEQINAVNAANDDTFGGGKAATKVRTEPVDKVYGC